MRIKKKQNTVVARHELNERKENDSEDDTTYTENEFILDSGCNESVLNDEFLSLIKKTGKKEYVTLGDGSKREIKKFSKMKLGDQWVSCINLGVQEPNLLSMTQLTGSGYTAICHEKGITVLPPLNTLQAEVQKLIRELSKRWEKYIVEVEKSDEGIYKLILNSRGEVKAPKDRRVFPDTCTQKRLKELPN